MTELVTTGIWQVKPGKEADFVAAWTQFAEWAATMPGSTTLRLGWDITIPGRYVSFAAWSSVDAAHAWKQSAEFRSRMAQVQQHVESFEPSELSVASTVASPSAPA